MHVSYLSRCRCSAQLDEQDEWCTVHQLVWSRWWAVPGCSDIAGPPQQACRLQLRIDVHHLSEVLTAADACAVPE